MNPLALFLLIIAVGFLVGAVVVAGTVGSLLNIFWLLGLAAVITSLLVQILCPISTPTKGGRQ